MNIFECTDKGNAERFQAYWGNHVRFVDEQRQWVIHSNSGWRHAQRFRLSGPVVRNIGREAAQCKDTETRKALLVHAKSSESTTAQRSMMAQAQDHMNISLMEFDTNPYVINCKNCILDLRTKGCSSHSPDQFHLKKANVSYDPKAECPRWTKVIAEIFDNDQSLIDYMQTMLGYSMMGLTREHVFFLCYGTGRNGKSLILETVGHVLGSYAKLSMDFETFLDKDKNSVRTKEAIGNLKGMRFAVASETSNSARLNPALIKKVTGGDTLEGSKMYGSSFEFKPTHKIWFACNHLPANMDASPAMTERVKVVPFKRNFLEDDKQTEKELKEFLIESEGPGIFNWLVEGAYRYNQSGRPKAPDAIRIATDDYLDTFDRLRVFIRDHLEKDRTSDTLAKEAYRSYQKWCADNNENEVSDRQFPTKLNERGVRCEKKPPGQTLIGWKLNSLVGAATLHPAYKSMLDGTLRTNIN
jgi:putative DNA primase/helicase